MAASVAVVVQCFVKVDTLKGTLESLLKCEGREKAALIIWQDGLRGSRRTREFTDPHEQVRAYIGAFISEHSTAFASIDYFSNDINLGCYATCKTALDFAFDRQDFAVLVEDDVILSYDALLWFEAVRSLGLLEQGDSWAIGGQSIFFDARAKTVDREFVDRALEAARAQDLATKFTTHSFVPSACFATLRRCWQEFGATRGERLGDVALCQRTKDEGRSCIFPMVSRAKDVGMLHDYGVSVTTHTKGGVQALTNPYVLAEDVITERPIRYLRLTSFEGDSGLLFRQSTLLEGFPRGNEKTTLAAPQPTGMRASGSTSQENVHVHANAREAFLEESELARVKTAEAAAAAGDWSSAASIWNELRCDFPGQVRYWLKEARACIEGGALNAAQSLLDEALALFPDDRWLAYQRVRLARMQGDWSKASKGAEALRRSAPDFWPGWVEEAHALAGLNRHREAEDLARQAVANFPGEFWPNYALARLEASKSTAPDAVRIWAALVDRFPGEPNAAAALAKAKRAEAPPVGQGNSSGRAA